MSKPNKPSQIRQTTAPDTNPPMAASVDPMDTIMTASADSDTDTTTNPPSEDRSTLNTRKRAHSGSDSLIGPNAKKGKSDREVLVDTLLQVPTLTSEHLLKLFTLGALKSDIEEREKLLKACEYKGINLQKIMRKVITIAANKDGQKEVGQLIALGLMRGNNIGKLKTSIDESSKPIVESLLNKYSIVAVAKNRSDDITLSRLALAFPYITCSILELGTATIIPHDTMTKIHSGYPACMMHQAFASLIPLSLGEIERGYLLDCHMVHQCLLSEVIGRQKGKSEKKPVDYLETCKKFAEVAMTGSPVTEPHRIALLKTWSVLDAKGVPSSHIIDIARLLHAHIAKPIGVVSTEAPKDLTQAYDELNLVAPQVGSEFIT